MCARVHKTYKLCVVCVGVSCRTQVHEATLELHNVGLRGLSELCCITSYPNTLVLGLEKAVMVSPDGTSTPWPRYKSST